MQESSATPHIDRVLRSQHQRRVTERERRDRERGGGARNGGSYELRLMQLEKQLSQLLQKTKVSKTTKLSDKINIFCPQTAQKKVTKSKKPHPPG